MGQTEKAESPNEPFILLSVFGQPSGSGSGPFDDIIDEVRDLRNNRVVRGPSNAWIRG